MASEEWISAEREHEQKMAAIEYDRAEREREHKRYVMNQWSTRFGYFLGAVVILGVILGIVWAFWSSAAENRDADTRLRLACIERGGSWTTLGSEYDKSCYQIGVIEEVDQ